jgi:hypothetical protein
MRLLTLVYMWNKKTEKNSIHLAHQCIQFVFSSDSRWSDTCSNLDRTPLVAWFWVSTFSCHREQRLFSDCESQHVLPMQELFDHLHVAIQPKENRKRKKKKLILYTQSHWEGSKLNRVEIYDILCLFFSTLNLTWELEIWDSSRIQVSFVRKKSSRKCEVEKTWKIHSPLSPKTSTQLSTHLISP